MIKTTYFRLKNVLKAIWTSSDGNIRDQIVLFLFSRRWHTDVMDVRTYREGGVGLYCGFDQFSVVAKLKAWLMVCRLKKHANVIKSCDVEKLQVAKRLKYQIEVKNRCRILVGTNSFWPGTDGWPKKNKAKSKPWFIGEGELWFEKCRKKPTRSVWKIYRLVERKRWAACRRKKVIASKIIISKCKRGLMPVGKSFKTNRRSWKPKMKILLLVKTIWFFSEVDILKGYWMQTKIIWNLTATYTLRNPTQKSWNTERRPSFYQRNYLNIGA